MDITTTVEELLSDENINEAIDFLNTKKNACGDDGIWLYDLESYWHLNGEKIKQQILNRSYYPQIVHEKSIITGSGKHRNIYLFSSVDRLLSRALLQKMQAEMDKYFSEYSFAYRQGKGIEGAVACAAGYVEGGKQYVLKIDLKDFFDSIPYSRLLDRLRAVIQDHVIYDLLEKMIVCTVESDYRLCRKDRGLLQGNPLSPLLSNFYLTEFDKWMEKAGYSFVRFADDINVYIENMQEGYIFYDRIQKKLQEYGLTVNQEKKGFFSVFSIPCLGYMFEKQENGILIKRYKQNKKAVWKKWHREAVEKVDQEYHIINDGILTRKDFSILFQNKEKKVHIPVETTDSISIYSNVELNSGFLNILNQRKLNLNVYNQYGVYLGSFYPNNQRNRMKCLVKQVEIYQRAGRRLEYARKMDTASLHNLRCNLQYYNKQYPSVALHACIRQIGAGIHQMKESECVEEVLMIEARIRQQYYQCFNQMIHDKDFTFAKRTKHPPQDEINAMISFGNVWLYRKIAQMIYRTGVDIRISFVHSAMKRNENLNLDIADIFKPIIVDRVICTLINKKMVSATKHFEHVGKGVLLNQDGKKIFLQELEYKIHQTLTMGEKKYSYEQIIFEEIRKLERSFLLDGYKYKPFKYRL